MFKKLRKLLIARSFTNLISFVIDYLLPPIIRDNKYFMFPFYYFAFRGKNIKESMNFKSNMYKITGADLEKLYRHYDTIGTERFTDLNRKSIKYILDNLCAGSGTMLDTGCGRGYLSNVLKNKGYDVTGIDIFDNPGNFEFRYVKANAEKLPYPDKSFDIVVSTHTLEHVLNIRIAVSELKRVAKKQVIVVVPCQRFNYYTLDHHLHFIPRREMLEGLMDIQNHTIKKTGGDWVYVGYV